MPSISAIELPCSGFASDHNILRPSAQGEEQPDSHRGASRAKFSLPQADRGKDAWMFLAACFVMEALVWGFPFAFGVFQDHYRTHEPFAGTSGIPIIGTCCLGIMYLSTPLIMALRRRYPKACLYTPSIGLIVMCASLVASSFAQKTWHLIITQGIMYGLSGAICYYPCLFYLEEWFVQRKGLAYGIMWSGSGIGGFVIPLLLQIFLNMWGFRTTLRIWATALFIITLPAVFFIKPRLPVSTSAHNQPYNLKFLHDKTFLLYQSANLAQGLGYFLPPVYLPTYTRSFLSAGPFLSALTVILVDVASVFGLVVVGFLSDRLHPTTCILLSTVGAVASVFFVWGFAANLPVLYVFCIMYGFFAGSYVSSWPGVVNHLTSDYAAHQGRDENVVRGRGKFDPLMVIGFLNAGRGVGNLISGPLSEGLIKGMPWSGLATRGYGSGYGPLIAFTGATAVVGGATFLWRRVGWM